MGKKSLFVISKFFGLVFMLGMFFVFLGMGFDAIFSFSNYVLLNNAVYSLLFLAFSIVFGALTVVNIKTLLLLDYKTFLKKVGNRKLYLFFVSVIIFVLLYLLRYWLASALLFLGYNVGGYFINNARQGYLALFNFDTNSFFFSYFAWIFQFIFIYFIVGTISRFVTRIWNRLTNKSS